MSGWSYWGRSRTPLFISRGGGLRSQFLDSLEQKKRGGGELTEDSVLNPSCPTSDLSDGEVRGRKLEERGAECPDRKRVRQYGERRPHRVVNVTPRPLWTPNLCRGWLGKFIKVRRFRRQARRPAGSRDKGGRRVSAEEGGEWDFVRHWERCRRVLRKRGSGSWQKGERKSEQDGGNSQPRRRENKGCRCAAFVRLPRTFGLCHQVAASGGHPVTASDLFYVPATVPPNRVVLV